MVICEVILAADGCISILMTRIYGTIRADLLGSQLENEGCLGSSPSPDNSLSSIKSLFSMKSHFWSTANPWTIACSIMEVKTFYPFQIKFYFLQVPVEHPEPRSFVSFIITLPVGQSRKSDVVSFKLKILVAFANDEENTTVRGAHQQGNNPTACSPNTTAGTLWLRQQYQKCRAQHWFPIKEEEMSFPSPSPSPHQDNQHCAK